MKNNKGISEVVTYVLLIVIAISLSAIVFAFLKGIVPKEQTSCPEGLSLIIKEGECIGTDKIYLTFQNKGRFKIDGIYSRYSDNENTAASNYLKPVSDSLGEGPINQITEQQAGKGFLYFGRVYSLPSSLKPNREYKQLFEYTGTLKKVEIQPFLNLEDERELAICEDKIIIHKINCPIP